MQIDAVNYFRGLSKKEVAELKHCNNLDDALSLPAVSKAWDTVTWPAGQESGLCVLLLLLSHQHKKSTDADFIALWGSLSVNKKNSIDINESRFIRLVNAREWDSFFSYALLGVWLLNRKTGGFSDNSLAEVVRSRADDWATLAEVVRSRADDWAASGAAHLAGQWELKISENFYSHQK